MLSAFETDQSGWLRFVVATRSRGSTSLHHMAAFLQRIPFLGISKTSYICDHQAAGRQQTCHNSELEALKLRPKAWDEEIVAVMDSRPAHARSTSISNVMEGEGLEERPQVVMKDGATYSGQWRGPKMHGTGILTRSNGQRHVGSFQNGQAHGVGTFVGANGSVYTGQFEHDLAHGFGKYIHVDGSTFEGEWRQDKKAGPGVESFPDGTQYVGQFAEGCKHGDGTYTACTGASYEGQFVDDRMEGNGVYSFSDGRVYSGQWEKGRMHGDGFMSWPSGARHEGRYQMDVKHGEGTLRWPDGEVFHGHWYDGQLHGSGVLVDAEGNVFPQAWNNGVESDASALRSRLRRISRHSELARKQHIGCLPSSPCSPCSGGFCRKITE